MEGKHIAPKSCFFKRKKEFPNHFVDDLDLENIGECTARIQLVSECVDHILTRLTLPHWSHNEIRHEGFFIELVLSVQHHLAQPLLDIKLYIGGGVVRSLISYIYKYIHTKKLYADIPLSTQEILNHLLQKTDKKFNHTEVLGVGSDLDIYYTITGCKAEDTQLLVEKIEAFVKHYINAVETQFNLAEYAEPLKKSFIPIGDVKPYNAHMEYVIRQGGSHSDWLAFELSSKTKETTKFKCPKDYPDIVYNLLIKGEYAYTSPTVNDHKPTPKQTLRGCRALVELPFVKIMQPEVLNLELDMLKSHDLLANDVSSQLEKLVRNAHFGLANNRVYRSKPDTPLARLANLSIQYHHEDTENPYLIPHFLQGYAHQQSFLINEAAEITPYLMTTENFTREYTDSGTLYHGTSQAGLLSILRAGFWMSDSELGQGNGAYGPGLYCTKSKATSESYAKESVEYIIPITLNPNYKPRIIDWEKVPDNVRRQWQDTSKSVGYSHVFVLLREEFGTDIIIHSHVLIQNFYAIKVPRRPEKLISSKIGAVLKKLECEENTEKKLGLFIEHLIPLFHLAFAANITLSPPLEHYLNEYKSLFIIRADYLLLPLFKRYDKKNIDFLCSWIDIVMEGITIDSAAAEDLFLLSAEYGVEKVMRALLKAGMNVNTYDALGNTALHFVVKNGHSFLIPLLVEHHALLRIPNNEGYTPAHLASKDPKVLTVFKKFIDDDFPTHRAAQQGDSPFILALPKHHESINLYNSYGLTPLHCAIINGHTAVVESLLKRQADILPTFNRCNPFELAIEYDHCVAIRYMGYHQLSSLEKSSTNIQDYVDVWTDNLKKTALPSTQKEIVNYLFNVKIEVQEKADDKLKTLLQILSLLLQLEIEAAHLRTLMQRHQSLLMIREDYPLLQILEEIPQNQEPAFNFVKPFIKINIEEIKINDDFSQEVFLLAVEYNLENVVQTLLDAKIDINVRGKNGESAVHICMKQGYTTLLKQLAQYQAIFDLDFSHPITLECYSEIQDNEEMKATLLYLSQKNDKDYPVHFAAKNGNLNFFTTLFENDSLQAYDLYGMTPLHYAISYGHEIIVDTLLKRDVNVTQKTFKGYTVAHLAAKHNHAEILAKIAHCLVSTKADIHSSAMLQDFLNMQDPKSNTAAHWAAKKGHSAIIAVLAHFKANLNLINSSGNSPAHLAAQYGQVEVIKQLIENQAVFGLTNNLDQIPEQCIWISRRDQNLLLKKKKLKGNLSIRDIHNDLLNPTSSLSALSAFDMDSLASLFFKEKKAVESLTKNDQRILQDIQHYKAHSSQHFILHSAAKTGDCSVFTQTFTECEVNQGDFYGLMPLHYAALNGNADFITAFFLQYKVEVNMICVWGCSALHLATLQGYSNVVAVLLQHHALFSIPFHPKECIMNYLRKCKIIRNIDSHKMGLPLHIAAAKGDVHIIELLIKNKAEISVMNKSQYTPLELAMKAEHLEVIDLLAQYEAKLDKPNLEGLMPTQVVVQKGQTSVLKLLAHYGVKLDTSDQHSRTLVHLAAKEGHVDIMELLAKYNVPLDSQDQDGQTPAHLAAKEGHANVIDFLAKHHALLNSEDLQGFTPVHWAIANGHINVIKKIINNSREMENIYNTPSEIMCTVFEMREKYCQAILHLCPQLGSGDCNLAPGIITRIEKLIASKITSEKDTVMASMSIYDLAYIMEQQDIMKLLIAEHSLSWISPDNALNNMKLRTYQCYSFRSSLEKGTSYNMLKKALREEKYKQDQHQNEEFEDNFYDNFYEEFDDEEFEPLQEANDPDSYISESNFFKEKEVLKFNRSTNLDKPEIETDETGNPICTKEEFFKAVRSGDVVALDQLNFSQKYIEESEKIIYDIDWNSEDSEPFYDDVTNCLYDSGSALMIAVDENHVEMVHYLLYHQANPNARCHDGWTILQQATENGNLKIVELLLEKGADPTLADYGHLPEEDRSGELPLEIARRNNYTQIEKLLKDYYQRFFAKKNTVVLPFFDRNLSRNTHTQSAENKNISQNSP